VTKNSFTSTEIRQAVRDGHARSKGLQRRARVLYGQCLSQPQGHVIVIAGFPGALHPRPLLHRLPLVIEKIFSLDGLFFFFLGWLSSKSWLKTAISRGVSARSYLIAALSRREPGISDLTYMWGRASQIGLRRDAKGSDVALRNGA